MKLAIVGLGNQGRKRLNVARSDVVATVDPVAPAAQYRRLDDVPLAAFEAACVCVPDDAKVDCLRYLLTNGKHVLVEKPLLADDSAFMELDDLARRAGVACYTAYNHRFEPHLARVKQVLDANTLGSLYLARMGYGNGTARNVRESPWRDQGLGVLSDLGSHLLDLSDWYFGLSGRRFSAWSLDRFENRAYDHALFGSSDVRPILTLETSLVCWRNTFNLDLFGERGSIHVRGLLKWGPSECTLNHRVFPSGRPETETTALEGPDPTWQREYDFFRALCDRGETSLGRDRQIQVILREVAGERMQP